MKTIAIFILILALSVPAYLKAQGQLPIPQCYANEFGPMPIKVVTEASQNAYVLGHFMGTVDLDPSPGTATVSSKGNSDMYIAKYSSTGAYLWGFALGDTIFESEEAELALDQQGNVLVIGLFKGVIDFDPSVNTATAGNINIYSAFVAKYNTNGVYQWAFTIENNAIYGGAISTDAAGNCFIAVSFTGTADFDPSPGLANHTASGMTGFIAKYSSSGAYQWAINVATSIASIKCDPSGNCYAQGVFSGSMDFDPSPQNTAIITAGNPINSFIAKYSASGTYLWANQVGESSTAGNVAQAEDMSVDTQGNCFITGHLYGVVDMDPSPNTSTIGPTAPLSDIFVAKYTALGIYQWAFSIQKYPGASSASINKVHGICTDAQGNCYITGDLKGTYDFDPSPALYTLSNLNASGLPYLRAFVAKYSGNKSFILAFVAGLGSGRDIAADNIGNIYLVGAFRLTESDNIRYNLAKYGCQYTGIGETSNDIDAGIYPNPGNGLFTVETGNIQMTMTVLNSLGEVILRREVNGEADQTIESFCR